MQNHCKKPQYIDSITGPRIPDKYISVLQMIAQQAKESPNSIAVEHEDLFLKERQLSYKELMSLVEMVGSFIRGLKKIEKISGPVAVCLPRSIEIIVVILGIIWSGSAWIPIDPSYSMVRISSILNDVGCKLCFSVSNESLSPNTKMITFKSAIESFKLFPKKFPLVKFETRKDDIAYIIFTSGSTGKPKGVVIAHKSLSHYVNSAIHAHQFNSTDRCLQFASLSFDASIEEIFCCLCVGGTLVLRTDEMIGTSIEFLRQCERKQITFTQLPTLFWHQVVEDSIKFNIKFPDCIRCVIVAGERMRADIWKLWREHQGNYPILINGYGATEATVISTNCILTHQPESIVEPPIGIPIANVDCYLLNADKEPVKLGEVGELVIGGDGVAIGYLNREEQTASKFIQIHSNVLQRVYCTGDLASWNGNDFVIVGRVDNQVKIRGFRVELSEIETNILQLSGVVNAKVVFQNNRLLGFLECQRNSNNSPESVKHYLAEILPYYMVPSHLYISDKLPRTAGDKIDVNSCSKLLDESLVSDEEEKDVNEDERLMRSIWNDILFYNAKLDDPFLFVGGNSLLAMKLLSNVRDIFKIDVSVAELFRNQKIRELCRLIQMKREAGLSIVSSNETGTIPTIFRKYNIDIPLSHGQKQFWLLASQNKAPVYNEPCVFYIPNPVNREALQKAFDLIFNRHEILRTSFHTNGVPVQRISEHFDFKLISVTSAWKDSNENASAFCRKLFNLESPPLLKAKLYEDLSAKESVLLIVMQHIIIDGHSFFGIVFPELQKAYEAFCQNKLVILPKVRIQYADYAVWSLSQKVSQQNIDYWKTHLSSIPEGTLTYDHPKLTSSSTGKLLPIDFGESLSNEIREFSAYNNVTSFVVILTALNLTIMRYTMDKEAIIATVSSQRKNTDLKQVVGYCSNTLLIKSRFGDNYSFIESVRHCEGTVLDAFHHEIPYETVIAMVGYVPINVMISIENPPVRIGGVLNPWKFSETEIHQGTSHFDIFIGLNDLDLHTSIIGNLEYNSDIFDPDSMNRFMSHFTRFLVEGISHPESPISGIKLVSDNEIGCQFDNNTLHSYDSTSDATLITKFHSAVKKYGPLHAVTMDDQSITFNELYYALSIISQHIMNEYDVQPGDKIALMMDRSIEMIVSLLSILEVGAACVPIDVSYPIDRQHYIITHSEAVLIITQSSFKEHIPSGIKSIFVDSLSDKSDQTVDYKITPIIDASSCCYVIYTSGSTGNPKGVVMPHKVLVNLIDWTIKDLQICEATKTLQYTSISFDVAWQEIFTSLCSGGELVLVRDSVRRDPLQLLQFIDSFQISRLFIPFTMLNQLATCIFSCIHHYPLSLKEIITAGEQLVISEKIVRMFEKVKTPVLYNHYGPSETHVVTSYKLQGSPRSWSTCPPIGKPIDNTKVFIVDKHGNLCPIGVPGEIFVSGIALADGYLNNPKESKSKFVCGFCNFTSDRCYATGDIGKWNSNLDIEYIGRCDSQFKFRGYRIEPAEIESKLNEIPFISSSIVDIYGEGDKRMLIAWVITTTKLSKIEIQKALRLRLPDHMIPSRIMELENFPLTNNGKVSRKQLQYYHLPKEKYNISRARDSIELTISKIWYSMFDNEISLDDDFFALGGHSLLAISLICQIQQQLDLVISMSDLFSFPTIQGLSSLLRTKLKKNQKEYKFDNLVAMKPGTDGNPIFLFPGAGGTIFYLQALAISFEKEYPVYGLQTPGCDGVSKLCTDLQELALQHADEICKVSSSKPRVLVGHSAGACVAIEVARVLINRGVPVNQVVVLDIPVPTRCSVSQDWLQWNHADWVFLISKILEKQENIDLGLNLEILRTLDDERYSVLQTALEEKDLLPHGCIYQVKGTVQTMEWCTHQVSKWIPKILKSDILVIRARRPFELTCKQPEILKTEFSTPTLGWETISDNVQVAWSFGDHMSMVGPRCSISLANNITNHMK